MNRAHTVYPFCRVASHFSGYRPGSFTSTAIYRRMRPLEYHKWGGTGVVRLQVQVARTNESNTINTTETARAPPTAPEHCGTCPSLRLKRHNPVLPRCIFLLMAAGKGSLQIRRLQNNSKCKMRFKPDSRSCNIGTQKPIVALVTAAGPQTVSRTAES